MANNGKEAERAFESYWEARGHIERLRDKKDLMGLNKGLKLADFAKPSDYIVSSPSKPLHYAEVRSTVNARAFSFNKIQPGQSKAALLEASRGNKAYTFYIYSYGLRKWFVMSCVEYKVLLDSGRKSVMFEELSEWTR